eukprot:CAMPEP_0172298706 /NCGR_PEP_ID=MMETSP1058-20130122/1239_1 /TAXON_ID=83371 /ORGANISM="Detonula confervacea, Strain CCMP 353" /LENGTH=352 /DNA_ID=CAMNT_0013007993 /DNA_START=56 /DNA_END=1114 /DNA_ORIENTATION=+
MTLLKKRLSKDMTPHQQQAKKAKMTHAASNTHAAARTAAAVAAADQFVYAQIMARIRQQQEFLCASSSSSSSRSTSPPRFPNAVSLSIVTPGMVSPQEVLSQAGASCGGVMPNSLPVLPFEKIRQQKQRTVAVASASQNPLEMLSRVSSQVADKTIAKTQPPTRTPTTAPPANKKPASSQQVNSATAAAVASTPKDEECYVGEQNSTNQRHGRGIMAYPNGCRYVGCFINDKRHGYGKCWYPNGLGIYTGYWKDNKKHGRGTMRYANGDVYEGEWMGDRPNGTGTLTMTEKGELYSGDFLNHEKHGRGMYKFKNGDVYEGGWKEDVRHGNGLYMFAKNRGTCREMYYNGVPV